MKMLKPFKDPRNIFLYRLLILVSCVAAIDVCLGQAPPNDNFANAIVLRGNSTIFTGSLTNATFEPGESANLCGVPVEGASVWWSWTATNSSVVVIESLTPTPDAS